MDRFTVSIDDALLAEFDGYLDRKHYLNRSEGVRDLIRNRLETDRLERAQVEADHHAACIASLSYIYNHHERELSQRITQAQHAHHDLVLSTLHVHLDHENCMEITVLKGPIYAVQSCADEIFGQTGVRHGKLNLVPVVEDLTSSHSHGPHHDHDHDHAHGHDHGHSHGHSHTHPKS